MEVAMSMFDIWELEYWNESKQMDKHIKDLKEIRESLSKIDEEIEKSNKKLPDCPLHKPENEKNPLNLTNSKPISYDINR